MFMHKLSVRKILDQWLPTFSVSWTLLMIGMKAVDPLLIKSVNTVTYKGFSTRNGIIRCACHKSWTKLSKGGWPTFCTPYAIFFKHE